MSQVTCLVCNHFSLEHQVIHIVRTRHCLEYQARCPVQNHRCLEHQAISLVQIPIGSPFPAKVLPAYQVQNRHLILVMTPLPHQAWYQPLFPANILPDHQIYPSLLLPIFPVSNRHRVFRPNKFQVKIHRYLIPRALRQSQATIQP